MIDRREAARAGLAVLAMTLAACGGGIGSDPALGAPPSSLPDAAPFAQDPSSGDYTVFASDGARYVLSIDYVA
jgi:hypothetical protein